MHVSKLKLVYIHNELLHVSGNYVAIFREGKYKGQIHYRVQNEMAKWLAETYRRSQCLYTNFIALVCMCWHYYYL